MNNKNTGTGSSIYCNLTFISKCVEVQNATKLQSGLEKSAEVFIYFFFIFWNLIIFFVFVFKFGLI